MGHATRILVARREADDADDFGRDASAQGVLEQPAEKTGATHPDPRDRSGSDPALLEKRRRENDRPEAESGDESEEHAPAEPDELGCLTELGRGRLAVRGEIER